MNEFRARVRRVKMKSGGADVRVLANDKMERGEEDFRGALVANAKAVAEMGSEDNPLSGYVLIGIFDDGATSVGFRYDWESARAIPRMLLPAWVAEVIRRDMISGVESRDVFNEMFWQEG